MKAQKTKGSYGYIRSRKRKLLFGSILLFGAAFAILILGMILNKGSKANVFTILSVLMVLPAAKIVVGFIVLFPYHTAEEQKYKLVKQSLDENVMLYTDAVFSSTEKVMMLDFICVDRHFIIGYGEQRCDQDGIRSYFVDGLKRRSITYQVEMYEDFDRFLNRIQKLSLEDSEKSKDYMETNEYLHSLIV